MAGFDYVEPFVAGFCWGRGEAVIKKCLDCCGFGRCGIFGDEADESTWGVCVSEM